MLRDNQVISPIIFNQDNFEACKLNGLKQFLSGYPELADSVEKAQSLGELWSLLFRHKHFKLYTAIVNAGISPTVEELNQKNILGTSAWDELACSSEGLALFEEFVNRKILPTSEVLARLGERDGFNVWHRLLAGGDIGMRIFNKLLDENKIYPDAKALSKSWSLLMKNDIQRFRKFIENNILPSAEDLALRDEKNANGWDLLCSESKTVHIAMNLFVKGIIPKSVYLSQISSIDGLHAWHRLARTTKATAFKWLLDHGIYPSEEDMSLCDPINNLNAWSYLLLPPATLAVFRQLLKLGIVPSSKVMAECSKPNNQSSWHLLCMPGDDLAARLDIFLELLQRGVLPTSENLAVISSRTKVHAWYHLSGVVNENGEQVLLQLLQLGIIPSASAMAFHDTEGDCWHRIAKAGKVEIIRLLLDQGILPSAENLAAKIEGKNTWEYLIEGRHFSLVYRLFELGIVPNCRKDISIDYSSTLQSYSNNADAGKIIKQIKSMNRIKDSINMLETESNEMVNLLSRNDRLNYYGFIYLYYLVIDREYPILLSLEDKNTSLRILPPEIWYKIGCYLLPPFISQLPCENKFNFFRHDNRPSFTKLWLTGCIEEYTKTTKLHKGRLEDLNAAMKSAENLSQINTLFYKQYLMSRGEVTQTYARPAKFKANTTQNRHREAFTEPNKDSEFCKILKTGALLSLRRR